MIKEGKVYFSAGIWPFMGSFIHCLDAKSGKVIWTNDSSGSIFMLQPHNSPAFAGPAPQGSLTVAGSKLLVPNGRSVPACFDKATGEFLYYRLAPNAKRGGSDVAAAGEYFFNSRGTGATLYHLGSGGYRKGYAMPHPVVTESAYYFGGKKVVAIDPKSIRRIDYKVRQRDRKTGKWVLVPAVRWTLRSLWNCPVDATGALIKAGGRLYAGGDGRISAIRPPAEAAAKDSPELPVGKVVWSARLRGEVRELVAANDYLIAVTDRGDIHCYGRRWLWWPKRHKAPTPKRPKADPVTARAMEILSRTKVTAGYGVVYGL
ncbi:hypothetical protein LCGC14_3007920, partial [marine sediment metagenome]